MDEHDLPIDEEIEVARGVYVARRSFLALGAACMATGVVHASAAASGFAPLACDGSSITFEEFLALANPLAKELVLDISRAGQDRYLLAIAAIAVRLASVAVPEMNQNSKGAGPATFIGFNRGGDPFNVLHWRMEPGAVIRTHPHTYGNVVTLVLDGEVRIRNYEMLGERDFDTTATFQVRETCNQVVSPGGTNLVNLERNYMHGFDAGPQGARGLDITTRIKEKRSNQSLELSKPVDAARGIYEASWITDAGT